jgi:hypothetical protein
MMRYFPNANYLLIAAQEVAHGMALKNFKAAHANVEHELCAASALDSEIHFDATDPMGGWLRPRRSQGTISLCLLPRSMISSRTRTCTARF